jgi:hypothetical protein
MFEQITKFATDTTDNVSRAMSDINNSVTNTVKDTNISERFTTTSDQVLDAVLDANRRIVDMAVTTADRVSEQFRSQVTVELPFTDRFPTPSVAGERYLEFVERAVSMNRDMNQRVAEMIKADNAKAASDKVVGAAKSVADTATKTVAKQVPVKKTVAKKAPAKKAAAKRPAKKTVAKKAPVSK